MWRKPQLGNVLAAVRQRFSFYRWKLHSFCCSWKIENVKLAWSREMWKCQSFRWRLQYPHNSSETRRKDMETKRGAQCVLPVCAFFFWWVHLYFKLHVSACLHTKRLVKKTIPGGVKLYCCCDCETTTRNFNTSFTWCSLWKGQEIHRERGTMMIPMMIKRRTLFPVNGTPFGILSYAVKIE